MKHICSFSGGKDSTAMTLRLMEENRPLDEVVFCDTGVEFPEIYESVKTVEKIVEDHGIAFTILQPKKPFEYYMFDVQIKRNRKNRDDRRGMRGYGWPGVFSRWCTRLIKMSLIEPYLRERYRGEKYSQYVGLAFDEIERSLKKNNLEHIHPLIEWRMTEVDCLQYCYERGIDFGGIYQHQKRASCWCCPFQSTEQLRNLYDRHPDLWKKLEEWDRRVVEEVNPKFLFHNTRVAEFSRKFKREFLSKKYQTKIDGFIGVNQ